MVNFSRSRRGPYIRDVMYLITIMTPIFFCSRTFTLLLLRSPPILAENDNGNLYSESFFFDSTVMFRQNDTLSRSQRGKWCFNIINRLSRFHFVLTNFYARGQHSGIKGPDYNSKFCSFEKSFEYFSNSFVKEVFKGIFKGLFKGPKFCIVIGTQFSQNDMVCNLSWIKCRPVTLDHPNE